LGSHTFHEVSHFRTCTILVESSIGDIFTVITSELQTGERFDRIDVEWGALNFSDSISLNRIIENQTVSALV
jgi:hypothetical protein